MQSCTGRLEFIHSGLKTQPKEDSDGEKLRETPLLRELLSECLISEKFLLTPGFKTLMISETEIRVMAGIHIQMIPQISIQFSSVCLKTSCFDQKCQFQSSNVVIGTP